MTFFYRRLESNKRSGSNASAKPSRRVLLQVERLEEREVPAQVFAVTTPVMSGAQNLITFDTATPGVTTTIGNITGLGAGETVVGIDIRPANGFLYAVTNTTGTGRLRTINTTTGVASLVGVITGAALTGTAFGVDFNPMSDRLRVVSNTTGQNLRIDPTTAVATVDTTVAFAATDVGNGTAPTVVASAYTNNVAGATSTTLYGIDSNLDRLVLQGSAATGPNGGVLYTRGGLGFNTNDMAGFDITAGNVAFASLTSTAAGTTNSTLVMIDLDRGVATTVGIIGGAATGMIQDLAVVPGTPVTPPPAGSDTGPATVFAVTVPVGSVQALISFNSTTPGTVTKIGNVTGLIGGAGEIIVGMDIRPANGLLYILTSAGGTGRIYTLNPATAVATPVSIAANFALAGTAFGMDFNPMSDRLRVVSNTGQNLRINPGTGMLAATDTTLAFAATDPFAGGMAPNVVAAGYTNDFAGATTTLLYGIDSNRDQLVIQGDATGGPNGGILFSRGGLGFDTTDQVSLDIRASNVAFATLTSAAVGTTNSTFAMVDLARGVVTTVGTIGGATTGLIQAMAIVPGAGPAPNPGGNQNAIINQLVIANLQAIFAQPLPPPIALARIIQIVDSNGDGFADVTALVGLRVRVRGRMAIQFFLLTFDGLSPSAGLIGVPRLLGTF